MFSRSAASISRTPISTVFSGATLGENPKMFASGSGPRPSSAASGMPCTLPDGEVSGVLMSEWASIQITPIFLALAPIKLGHARYRAGRQRVVAAQHQRRHALFQRLDDGFGGSRTGLRDLLQVAGTRAADVCVSAISTRMLPPSCHLVAQRLKRASRPATRMAEGPMSTPRRLAPMSSGTPITRMRRVGCA